MFTPRGKEPTRENAARSVGSVNALSVSWIPAEDASQAVLFLASDAARYITGETLHVAAGWNASNSA